jgi:hypothetical protein
MPVNAQPADEFERRLGEALEDAVDQSGRRLKLSTFARTHKSTFENYTTLAFAPPHPSGVKPDGRKTNYRQQITPANYTTLNQLKLELPQRFG